MSDVYVSWHLVIQGLREGMGRPSHVARIRAHVARLTMQLEPLTVQQQKYILLNLLVSSSLSLRVHQRFNLLATASEFTRQSCSNPTPVQQWYASPAPEHDMYSLEVHVSFRDVAHPLRHCVVPTQ